MDQDSTLCWSKREDGSRERHLGVTWDMPTVMIEVMVEGSKQIVVEELNPFKEKYGEILPTYLESNFSGFFAWNKVIPFKVNSEKLIARIANLKDQILIGKFVGPKLAS